MISIIITSFKEPKTIGKSIESFTNQKIKEKYELIVAVPDKETQNVVKKYCKKNNTLKGTSKIKLFKDPGKGKSYALNLLLPKLKGEFIILSDGDVFVSENSVNEILKKFKDLSVGCVSGRVVSDENRKKMFGYWSHLLCDAAHKLRKKRNNKNKFLECSGYLWGFRNKVIKKFPLDVGEDTIVPIMFYLKNYEIKYAEKAEVYVKFPTKINEFLKQKRRTAGAHDNISKYVNVKKIPRMKTFFNEVGGGVGVFFSAKSFKELIWTFCLFPFRLYIWMNLFYNSYVRKRKYSDAWKRVESSK